MKSNNFCKTLLIILWNITAFVCSIISFNNIVESLKTSFSFFTGMYRFLFTVYNNTKKILVNINLKQNQNKADKVSARTEHIYKNKNSATNRTNNNNNIINLACNNAYLLYTKRLKDALATQIFISKVHFIRLEDKCAHFFPFAVQKFHYLIFIVLI